MLYMVYVARREMPSDDLVENQVGVQSSLEILLELVHFGSSEGEEVGPEYTLRGQS
jgi:hypothetical protein